MCNRLDGEANNGTRSVDVLSSSLACHFIYCLFCFDWNWLILLMANGLPKSIGSLLNLYKPWYILDWKVCLKLLFSSHFDGFYRKYTVKKIYIWNHSLKCHLYFLLRNFYRNGRFLMHGNLSFFQSLGTPCTIFKCYCPDLILYHLQCKSP